MFYVLKNKNEDALLKIEKILKNTLKYFDKEIGKALIKKLNLLRKKIENIDKNSIIKSSIFKLF